MSPTNEAAAYYDAHSQREWDRLQQRRTEFAVTLRAIYQHLPPPPAHILDVGGGPGRYAIELAGRGYRVTLLDISRACLEIARAKAAEARVPLDDIVWGDALDLSRFGDASFDGVLLLGPLYHLINGEDRVRALREALRVLVPTGALFAAFLGPYAGLRWAAKYDPMHLLEHRDEWKTLFATGVAPLSRRASSVPNIAVHWIQPNEIRPLIESADADVVDILGCEGIVCLIDEAVNALSGDAWEAWVDLNYTVARDPSIHGAVEHLLCVARKRVGTREVVPHA